MTRRAAHTPLFAEYAGVRYIDLAVAYPEHVPARFHTLSGFKGGMGGRLDRWKCARTLCRFTCPGNIDFLDLSTDRRRSVWMPVNEWERVFGALPTLDAAAASSEPPPPEGGGFGADAEGALDRAQIQPESDASPYTGKTSLPEAAGKSSDEPPLKLARIELGQHTFIHQGTPLAVAVYGELTLDGMYIKATDVVNSLGVRHTTRLPNNIIVKTAIVDGVDATSQPIDVLSYHEFVATVAAYRHVSGVAHNLFAQVTALVFVANHGTPEDRENIREISARYTSRVAPFRSETYFGDFTGPCEYMLEVCTVSEFKHAQPDAIVPILPGGEDASANAIVVKKGYGTVGPRRVHEVRSDLRALVPGADARPISVQKYPGATEAVLKAAESEWTTEHEDRRIGGVQLRKRGYTELFAFQREEIESAVRFEGEICARFVREKETVAADALADAKAAKIAAITERDFALQSARVLELRLQEKEEALAARSRELDVVKEALANALPKKMAALFGKILRC